MAKLPLPLPLILLCFISFSTRCAESKESQILLTLKNALQDSNPSLFVSWQSENSVCNFTGITCGNGGYITEIDLTHGHLSGVLPFHSLCELPFLVKLAFGFNSLHGTVTADLNGCTRLRYLDLGNNRFTGSFPDISSLTELEVLHLNLSGFSGVFPWKSLSRMDNMTVLSLGDNPFDRSPFPEEILELVNLRWLYMSNCSIGGVIPVGIGRLTKLEDLELAQNSLFGPIPESIGNLTNLWQLEIYGNNLTGSLPFGLRNLRNLKNFDASENHLTGELTELKFLTRLVSLQLFDNNFTGEIPVEFGEFKMLVNLSLYRNHLTGALPHKLGLSAEIDFIDVSENNLTGPIPPYMCSKGKMKGLLMLLNNLNGGIPATYENCTSLVRFRVSNNMLSGEVPPRIWGLPRADIIDFAYNNLEGGLTSDIRYATSLKDLFISNNRLSGEIPPEISQAAELVSLEMNDNQFSGGIPASIGDLKNVIYIHLHNNKLSGSIPESLGHCVTLDDLNLANNSLSGNIPSSLGKLSSLTYVDLSNNALSGQIPTGFSDLKLSFLNLSNNALSGPVPESLSNGAYNGSLLGNHGLCYTTGSSSPRCSSSRISNHATVLISLCFILLLLVSSLIWVLHSTKDEDIGERSLKEESWDVSSFHVLSFTEDEIIDSIKEENLVGKGGSGNVYKASLKNGDDLAVKHCRLNLGKRKQKAKEFEAEVQTLSSIRHVNVVKLFCSITSEDSSLLVYEYLPNGSLWDNLHTSLKVELDWETRYEIAVGAAKGLEYLHHGCEKPVIHRDVKSSNILLDEFFKPRIADFGLAKIHGSQDSTHVIAGTHGYIAPEYGYAGKVNEKSDVYSFGVVLMELVSGKRPIEAEFGENKDIVEWVSRNLKTKETVLGIVDSRIPEVMKEDAIKVLRIAILCTARSPCLRPTMRSVVQMLEAAEPCKLLGIVISKDVKEGR